MKFRVDNPRRSMLYYLSFRVTWSVGSVGRAHRSHRWGHWFESSTDHQISPARLALQGFSLQKPRVHTDGGLPTAAACGGFRPSVNGSSPVQTTNQPCEVSLAGFFRFDFDFPIDFPPVRADIKRFEAAYLSCFINAGKQSG